MTERLRWYVPLLVFALVCAEAFWFFRASDRDLRNDRFLLWWLVSGVAAACLVQLVATRRWATAGLALFGFVGGSGIVYGAILLGRYGHHAPDWLLDAGRAGLIVSAPLLVVASVMLAVEERGNREIPKTPLRAVAWTVAVGVAIALVWVWDSV